MEDCKRYVKIGENNGKGGGEIERVLEKWWQRFVLSCRWVGLKSEVVKFRIGNYYLIA